ncbi:ceramide glucosyltransferase, partial [Salmonella enterica subsp. enterica]|nr:ceramide glucosyltransferase [Salmonella enterica subsp. enterica serovar Enteritidis]
KWNAGPRYLVAMVVRDMLLPLIALRGWMGAKVEWRGNAMNIGADVQVLE